MNDDPQVIDIDWVQPNTLAFDQDDLPVAALSNEKRCPCILLLDTSSSMRASQKVATESGKKRVIPIEELNQGLKDFAHFIRDDEIASLRLEVAVLSFGGTVTRVNDFTPALSFQPESLKASGSTPLGEAIQEAMEMLDHQLKHYKTHGLLNNRPWLIIISDGAPTDSSFSEAAKALKARQEQGKVDVYCVGVSGADMNKLAQCSTRPPLPIPQVDFSSFFEWLSVNLSAASRSRSGEQIALTSPNGWATTTT